MRIPLLAAAVCATALLFTACTPDTNKPETSASTRVNAPSERTEVIFQTALESADKNDWPRAHGYIDELIKREPKNDKYVYHKARFFYLAGEYAMALELARKAEALKNETAIARHLQALSLIGLSRPAEAEPILDQLCNDPIFAFNFESCINSGELQLTLKNDARARIAFQRAVQLDDKDPRGHYNLCEIAWRAGEFKEAASRGAAAFDLAQSIGYKGNFLPTYGPLYALCAARGAMAMKQTERARELCTEGCRLSAHSENCRQCETLLGDGGR